MISSPLYRFWYLRCLSILFKLGKMVLKLLKYVKLGIIFFINQRPPLEVTWRHLIGWNFLLQIWHIWAILRLFYPLVKFWSGYYFNIFSQKTYFQGLTNQFFSCGHLYYASNKCFWKENFLKIWSLGVMLWNLYFLWGLFLIG